MRSTVDKITRDIVGVIGLTIFTQIYLMCISFEFEDRQNSLWICRLVAKNIIIFNSFPMLIFTYSNFLKKQLIKTQIKTSTILCHSTESFAGYKWSIKYS